LSKLALSAVLAGMAAFPLAAVAATPPAGDQAAAVFPPGWSHARILEAAAAADARLVRFSAVPGVAVLEIKPAGHSALRAAGAWIIADPALAGGCFTLSQNKPAAPAAAYSGSLS